MDCVSANGVQSCNFTCTCTCTCKCNCICNGWENTPYGNLDISHHGAYTARFYISWDEPTVVGNSVQMVRKEWENNGHWYTQGFSTSIPIIMTAQNISIKAEGNTGLVWQLWNTIVQKIGLPMVPKRTVTIFGTSLDQFGSIDPDSGGTSGYLYIDHYGSYIARFYISWDEPVSINNNVYIQRREWEDNGKYFTSPYHAIIPMPMTSSNIDIKAQADISQQGQQWEDVVDKKGLTMVQVRTVTLRGTFLVPMGYVEPS